MDVCSAVGLAFPIVLDQPFSPVLCSLLQGRETKKREDAEFKEREGEAYTVGTAI